MQWTALKDYEQNFGIHGAGLEDDDDTSSVELQRLIARKFGVDISTAAIRTYLHKSLQWAVVRTRYGPMITDTNKQKRMDVLSERCERVVCVCAWCQQFHYCYMHHVSLFSRRSPCGFIAYPVHAPAASVSV